MSAIAFILTSREMNLYSDGLVRRSDGINHQDYKKIEKIHDSLAIMIVGSWLMGVKEHLIAEIQAAGETETKGVADIASSVLSDRLSDMSYESDLHPGGKSATHLLVFGYEDGVPVHYLVSSDNYFKPQKIPITSSIFVGSMIYGNWKKEDDTFKDHLSRTTAKTADLAECGREAFRLYLQDFIHTGAVNETIFHETIMP